MHRSSGPLIVLTALLAAVASSGAAGAGETPASLARDVDRLVAPYVAAADFHGVVAVARDGEPALVRAYGPASVELAVPHRPEGVFQIGSVSKQFTAAAILLLAEDGALDLDDPAAKHLAELAGEEVKRRITVRQLLTHTAGVADVYSLPRFGATGGLSGRFADVVADLAAMPLTHEPGSAYAYSNGGYTLLAAVVESASGTPYGEFLARRIFGPLAMTDTAHDAPGLAAARRVPGYDPWGLFGLTPVPTVAPAYTAGSGSIWSSAGDLVRWSEALHGGRVLAPASYAEMTRDHGHGYGFGVSVFRRFGRAVIGHDGRVAGYASDLARYVDDRLTVVILSNVQSVARDEIRWLAAAAALRQEIEKPTPRVYAAVPTGALDDLAGVYSFGPTLGVTITAADGRLLARANQGGTSELVPLAGGGWFSRMLYTAVRFGRDEEGRVDRLFWGLGAGAPSGRRVAGP